MERLLRLGARILMVLLLAAFSSAILIRYSPGALVDERELNQKLSETSIAAIRSQQERRQNLAVVFWEYFRGLPKGDLGYSESNNAPVAALIRDRAPETIRELAIGLTVAWFAGFVLSIPGVRWKQAFMYSSCSAAVAGFLLSLPVTLLAYFSVATGTPAGLVMGVALAPRIFRFSRNMLQQAYGAQHIEMARASGISEPRIFATHALPAIAPQMVALVATSLTMAIGAAIPIEAICDTPGLGRLAWQAATARDLPLLVNLTMLIAFATTIAMAASESLTRQS